MAESNTVVSAYTLYRHLQQYCSLDIFVVSQLPFLSSRMNTEMNLGIFSIGGAPPLTSKQGGS